MYEGRQYTVVSRIEILNTKYHYQQYSRGLLCDHNRNEPGEICKLFTKFDHNTLRASSKLGADSESLIVSFDTYKLALRREGQCLLQN